MNNYRPDIGSPGMVSDTGKTYKRSYSNVADDVAQVSTLTVGTYAASATYLVTINGQTISYTAPTTGGSAAMVASALISEINLSGLGAMAVSTGGAAFTVTSLPGEPLSLTASATGGGAITAVLTTPAVATGKIQIGLAVVRAPGDPDRSARLGAADATHKFLGVTIETGYMTRQPNSNLWTSAVYERGDLMLVMEEGRCFVQIETDITPDDDVCYRYTGTGVVGAFSGTAGATGTQQLLNARWVSSGKAGGFAEIWLGCVAPVPAA
ncbi:MAG TPA: hypothetical protein V6D33_01080 [Cyanophyceae cyanobacterium]